MEYVLKVEVIKTPQQNNGSDCGVFCIGFISNIVNKGATSFLGAVETGDISSWLELEGASSKRRDIFSYIEKKSKEQGLEDWRIKRDSKTKASGKENMKEVDSKDVVEQVEEVEEEYKYKEKEVEVEPVVELGEDSKYKENVKNENLQECLLRLKLGLEEEKDEEKLITLINEAEQQEDKASDLKATLIGKALISIRKANGDNKIGKATTKLLDKWRAQVKREIIQEEKELEIVEQ